MCVYVHMYVDMQVCIYVDMYYVCMHARMYVYVCKYVLCVCRYICM